MLHSSRTDRNPGRPVPAGKQSPHSGNPATTGNPLCRHCWLESRLTVILLSTVFVVVSAVVGCAGSGGQAAGPVCGPGTHLQSPGSGATFDTGASHGFAPDQGGTPGSGTVSPPPAGSGSR